MMIMILRSHNKLLQNFSLQKTLSSPNFSANGATGAIQFLPTGDRNGAAILVKVQPGNQSSTGYEFVPLRGVF